MGFYMELYIDVVFLVTWGMDAFLLWAAGQMCGFSGKIWRILFAGFLEALGYCVWICMFWQTGVEVISFLLLGMGVFLAYYPKQFRNWVRLFCATWAGSFLMGGGIHVLFTTTQVQQVFGCGMVVTKQYPWWLLPWGVGVHYVCLKLAGKWLEANIQRRKEFCTATVVFQERRIDGHVLIDTGNGLQKDGRGVAVMQLSAMLPLFTKEETVKILSGEREGLFSLPYSSLGNANGRLWGIQAEKLMLSFGEKQVTHENIFVGIHFDDFSGGYEGIVPPALLKEE